MKGIEFYHYDDRGYKKLFHYNSWRIAVLNYIEELEPENINYMECHNLTDEVFVLLEGEAVIYVLEDEKIVGYKLRKNEICNIKKGVYHTHVLSKDAKLLIIEEESTSYDNSSRIYIKDEQKKQIKTIWENRNKYKLVWEDDFNIDGPVNPKIWNVEHAGTGFGNNEDQYYTPREKNLYCKDSILHIVAHQENYKHRKYTSAKITSYGKKSIGYGMVEVKAKLPKGKGTWPAIWMLAESIRNGVRWPLCGEIDIMENIGRNHEEVHFSLHSKLYNHVIKTQQTYFETIPGVTERFSVYKMIWEPNYIKFFVDDKEYVTFTKGEDNRDTTKLGWPFEPPYFLILNLAIGGNWGGEIDDLIFPQEFLIDYVKVYERID